MNSQSLASPLIESNASDSESMKVLDSQLAQRLQERQKLLGAVTWLMMNSPLHSKYTVQEISERILPSVLHNQFRIYEQNGRPIGFVNWAFLTDEIEENYKTARYELNFSEWVGGPNLWFPEFIAPFGHIKYIVRDLRKNVFPNHTGDGKGLKVTADGKLKGIIYYKKREHVAQAED